VDSSDVERDVTEHIEKSLAEAPTPVDSPALRAVLDQLGSPSQWIPEEDLSWRRRLRLGTRRVLNRLWSGPEDFRLAYLSIGLFALAILLFTAIASPAWGLICVGFSFLFARAALAAESASQDLGAQRWLLYPVLILVYLPLALLLLLWTVAVTPLVDLAQEEVEPLGRIPFEMLAIHFAASFTALWWLVLGLVLWRWPRLVRNTFYPFANGFGGRHSVALGLVGLLILVVAVVVGGWTLQRASVGTIELIVPGNVVAPSSDMPTTEPSQGTPGSDQGLESAPSLPAEE
jgi:hypothetical protein